MAEITYTGTSMFPTFVDGDRLIYRRQNIYRGGDVILYLEPDSEERYIIHRVIRVEGDNLRTAGDNNPETDHYILEQKQVMGRIVKMTRAGQETEVWGGKRGFLCYWYARKGRGFIQALYYQIAPTYLKAAGLINPILSSVVTTRPVIVILKDSRIRIWLCVFHHCAGWWNHTAKEWYIRPEYRFFINPAQLPDHQELIKEGLAQRCDVEM